jgi:hypothetical protein
VIKILFAETPVDDLGDIFRLGICLHQKSGPVRDEIYKWALCVVLPGRAPCADASTHDFRRLTLHVRPDLSHHAAVAGRLRVLELLIYGSCRPGKGRIGRWLVRNCRHLRLLRGGGSRPNGNDKLDESTPFPVNQLHPGKRLSQDRIPIPGECASCWQLAHLFLDSSSGL